MSKTVILTGASGYVGQHILGELLYQNYKVIAIVRSQKSSDTLSKLFKQTPKLQFEIVEQFDKPHALDKVLEKHKEATIFISTAAVVTFHAEDYERDVLDPAIDLVKNIFSSIKEHAPQITRVILTSSSASVVGLDKAFSYDAEYSDNDWSPFTREMSTLDGTMAYFASKKLAEKEAWKFLKEEKPNFDLVAIMPALILGPARFSSELKNGKFPSTSGMIGRLLHLKSDDPIQPMAAGAVDVRDVAKVHVDVITSVKASNQRILVESGKVTNDNIIQTIIDNFPSYKDKLPTPNPVPHSKFVKPKDERSRKIIGFSLRSLDDSVVDLVKQIDQENSVIESIKKLDIKK